MVLPAALLLALPVSARAVTGTIDNVPAATLLLPYFEVDPAGTSTRGATTLLTVTDASATAILAHVTVWTDASVPVTQFNLYFTGYDTITFDLQSVLAGTLPATASAGQDQDDTISNHGPKSQDINFASCNGKLPPPPADPAEVSRWQAALSGKPVGPSNLCSGFDHGDGIMRGYVTIDTVNNCTNRFPSDPEYIGVTMFSGDITYQNTLWGTWGIVDKSSKRIHSASLVAVEADYFSASNPELTTPGGYTFYGRYNGWQANDRREPLATTYSTSFTTGESLGSPTRTTLVVWRDTKVAQGPFTCSAGPLWHPLAQESITFFDEQEETETLASNIRSFPLATQKVVVDSAELPTTFASGWVHLNLNTSVPVALAFPPEDSTAAQGWVETLRDDSDLGAYGARGHVAVTQHPVQLDNATQAQHLIP
jgi:hypothetical protein